MAICSEWIDRGYKDTCLDKILAFEFPPSEAPKFLGYEPFHRSHKSNLLRKDPEYYGKHFLGVPQDIPYLWPREIGVIGTKHYVYLPGVPK